ncbi:hypothetical protein GH733_005053 [Mirounga leonina]|nr:hypothetical protein GH733_005053 [Mirounga leonina]
MSVKWEPGRGGRGTQEPPDLGEECGARGALPPALPRASFSSPAPPPPGFGGRQSASAHARGGAQGESAERARGTAARSPRVRPPAPPEAAEAARAAAAAGAGAQRAKETERQHCRISCLTPPNPGQNPAGHPYCLPLRLAGSLLKTQPGSSFFERTPAPSPSAHSPLLPTGWEPGGWEPSHEGLLPLPAEGQPCTL